MTAITFDTLKFANRLKQAGVTPAHAEAEAQALAEVFETNLSDLATKGDLLAVKADVQVVKIEVQHLEQRITAQLALLEQRMTIKLGGLMVVAVSIVATLVKLL
jgi:hypothetical protein